MQDINKKNLDKEILSDETWDVYYKAYFGKVEPMQELYSLLEKEKLNFPKEIILADLGGADGSLGEFFKRKMLKSHKVKLYVVEIIRKLLDKNKNKDTIKINEDLKKFIKKDSFDLILMRSVLHYFSKSEQLQVLKNVRESLKFEGYILIQTFIPDNSDLELFLKLNNYVKRNLQLLNKEKIIILFREAGFSEIKDLGDISTWNLSSKDFQKRYRLTGGQINYLNEIVEKTHSNLKKGFKPTKNDFTIPIPYQVFLLKK